MGNNITYQLCAVADLGEGPRGLPLFWVRNEEMTGGQKAGKASKTKLGPFLNF